MRPSLAAQLDVAITGRSLRSLMRSVLKGVDVDRRTLVRTLEAAFLDRDTYEWYLTQLAIVTNAKYDCLDSISDEESERVLSEGLDTLNDDELYSLATNPVAIIQLAEEINDTDTDSWQHLKTLVGSELLNQLLPRSSKAASIVSPPKPADPDVTRPK
ncbi:MAG: hypothetical protein O2856_13860 [Planctomycetota bacterium]|nr:hypothetical protein [Planctomycetota bacterium]